MRYITIYDSPRQNQITIIRHLFEEHNIKHRVFDESTNNAIPVGVRVQVQENQVQLAKDLLKEYGFLRNPMKEEDSGSGYEFWWFFFAAIFLIVVFSILITWFMGSR